MLVELGAVEEPDAVGEFEAAADADLNFEE